MTLNSGFLIRFDPSHKESWSLSNKNRCESWESYCIMGKIQFSSLLQICQGNPQGHHAHSWCPWQWEQSKTVPRCLPTACWATNTGLVSRMSPISYAWYKWGRQLDRFAVLCKLLSPGSLCWDGRQAFQQLLTDPTILPRLIFENVEMGAMEKVKLVPRRPHKSQALQPVGSTLLPTEVSRKNRFWRRAKALPLDDKWQPNGEERSFTLPSPFCPAV